MTGWLLGFALAAALLVALLASAGASAATTFGGSLSVAATLNTSENLRYQGTNTAVPPTAEDPSGSVHTSHFGADTALWNTSVPGGSAGAPAAGQAVRVRLEGCAQRANGGPEPLTQIHFQSLSPLPGGGVKVNLSSQPYNVPVCGEGGASGWTVTTYEPFGLCVGKGDYVGLNDEGGFVEPFYRSGVPYEVLGAAAGATVDSFIKGNGTGNGAVLSPSEVSPMDGFASTEGAELMLQATLGTGREALTGCGGTHGVFIPPAPGTPVKVGPQTDGVNHARIVSVAIFCRLATPCSGLAELVEPGASRARRASFGSKRFTIPAKRTAHVPIRVSERVLRLVRKYRSGTHATLSVAVAGKTVTQTITVKIY